MVCGSSAMPTCPRPASALPRNTRSPGSTSAAPTGVVTANRSAWVAGSEMPAAPYTDCTSDPQSHDSGPAVPGA